jgi:hypothetical protein
MKIKIKDECIICTTETDNIFYINEKSVFICNNCAMEFFKQETTKLISGYKELSLYEKLKNKSNIDKLMKGDINHNKISELMKNQIDNEFSSDNKD